MILAYAVMLLIIIAFLLRRDLNAIGRLPYRGGKKLVGLIVGLFVLQATTVLYVPGQTNVQMTLLILSQLALIGFSLLNRHLPGAKVFAFGAGLNIMVMMTNGGWMPVTLETYHFVHPDRNVEVYDRPPSSKNIILPRAKTNLWILSDIIRVTLPWRRNAVSVGDVLLIVGIAQFIFQTTAGKSVQSSVSKIAKKM